MNTPGIIRVGQIRDNGIIIIFIEDSGPGVQKEDLPRLFERLFRVDRSRNRNKGGSGLGLSICESIMKSFDGSIRAVKSDFGGLRIEMVFPGRASEGKNE